MQILFGGPFADQAREREENQHLDRRLTLVSFS